MTDQLPPGPELDRIVAEAMGWHVGFDGPEEIMWKPTGDRSLRATLHDLGRFSRDPSHIPEMVEWLKSRDSYYDFVSIETGMEIGRHFVAIALREDVNIQTVGQTIQHALALLVVAVAAQQKQEKP